MAGIAWLVSRAKVRLSHDPVRRARLVTGLLCRQLCVLAVGTEDSGTRRRVGARDKISDSLGNGGNDKAAQLLAFHLVFLLKTETLVLVHVLPADCLDFLHNIEHNLFRASVALAGVFILANISPRHVRGAVKGEGDTV